MTSARLSMGVINIFAIQTVMPVKAAPAQSFMVALLIFIPQKLKGHVRPAQLPEEQRGRDRTAARTAVGREFPACTLSGGGIAASSACFHQEKLHPLMLHKPVSIGKTCQNICTLKPRIPLKQRFHGIAGSKHSQHMLHRQTSATDDRGASEPRCLKIALCGFRPIAAHEPGELLQILSHAR